MKAYTDLEQSHKLMEVLSIDSADMYYDVNRDGIRCIPEILVGHLWKNNIPCWSLAALYAILPDEIKDDGDIYRLQLFHLKAKYFVSYPRLTTLWPIFAQEEGDNSVDACYKMIVKLHEQKLI